MKRNVSWMAAASCVFSGVMLSYHLHTNKFVIDYQSLAIRIVFYIGPLGWLLFSMLAAYSLIRFRGAGVGGIFVICFLSAAIAAGCILMFMPFSHGPFLAR
jgi:hypothetical protein